MKPELLDLALEHDEIADLDEAERRLALRALLQEKDPSLTSPADVTELADQIDGFGPLTALMRDPDITDVLVNGGREIWIERNGALELTGVSFDTDVGLREWIDRVLSQTGVRADASQPIADARLKDGSRLHVVLPPVASSGPLVSIRRWPRAPLSLDDLVATEMVGSDEAAMLARSVREKKTISISGATGTGKTTLLNALLAEVPPEDRVVVLEETAELRPRCAHHVRLLTRMANVEGVGRVDLGDLVRASLRMRPDRIVIGEVRGQEALAALAAMSVGHEGSLVTVHARSAEKAVDRLVSLALLAESAGSPEALRRQVIDAFDVFVHLARTPAGARLVSEIKIGGAQNRRRPE